MWREREPQRALQILEARGKQQQLLALPVPGCGFVAACRFLARYLTGASSTADGAARGRGGPGKVLELLAGLMLCLHTDSSLLTKVVLRRVWCCSFLRPEILSV